MEKFIELYKLINTLNFLKDFASADRRFTLAETLVDDYDFIVKVIAKRAVSFEEKLQMMDRL